MDIQLFKILKTRYAQLGGLRLVREYSRMGLLWPAIKSVARHPFSRQTYKNVYFDTIRKVRPFLIERYKPLMKQLSADIRDNNLVHIRGKKVWFCWLQGLDKAPGIVKACHNSLVKHLSSLGYEVIVVDESNWRTFVDLPVFIIQRRAKGQIPPAHFADLLRLELLIKYGGSWIDATVLCTGTHLEVNGDSHAIEEFLDTDLFMFQYTRPGSSEWGGIGNWFISSCTNNEVLMVLRDMLFAYWREHNCVLDYYMFHLFFSMLRAEFPQQIALMPYGYAPNSLTLVKHWAEAFDEAKWNKLVTRVSFHKLTYMVDKETVLDNRNYYNHVLAYNS